MTLIAQSPPLLRLTPPLGPDAGGEFCSLANGDFDGDGVLDLAIGQPSTTGRGRVVLYSGIDRAPIRAIVSSGDVDTVDGFGRSVEVVGDLDADGRPDLVVGVPVTVTGARVVAISSATGQQLWAQISPIAGLAFGWSLARIADVNGDGVVDVIVGSPRLNGTFAVAGPSVANPNGAVSVLSGADGSVILQLANTGTTNTASSFGNDVIAVDDLDGDGLEDIAVAAGTPVLSTTYEVLVFSSNFGALLGLVAQGLMGNSRISMLRHGDVDNDGIRDMLISHSLSHPIQSGRLTCFSSNGSGALWSANDSGFGQAMTLIADLDNDNVPEIACSNTLSGAVPMIRVVSGRDGSTLWNRSITLTGTAGSLLFGYDINQNRDLDGDGRNDLVAIVRSSKLGAQLVGISAATGQIQFLFQGIDGQEAFGAAVIETSDFDGDGQGDLLIGAPRFSSRALRRCGAAYLVSSQSGSVIKRFDGRSYWQHFGTALAELGDVNADGVSDLAIGSLGRVEVVSGSDRSLIWVVNAPEVPAYVGMALTRIPDRTGDGVSELAASNDGTAFTNTALVILNGVNGNLVHTVINPEIAYVCGRSLILAGDLDADGVSDLVAPLQNGYASLMWLSPTTPVIPSSISTQTPKGPVLAVSMGPGTTLWTTSGQTNPGVTVSSASVIKDRNGDGVSEVMIGSETVSQGSLIASRIQILSGATGAALSLVATSLPNESIGTQVTSVGDQDGDLINDFAAASTQPLGQNSGTALLPARNRIRVFSGANLELISALSSDSYNTVSKSDGWGFSLTSVRDWSGDGRRDLAIGAPNGMNANTSTRSGYVDVASVSPMVSVIPVGSACVMMVDGVSFTPEIGTAGGPPAVQTGNPGFSVTLQGAPPSASAALFYAPPSLAWNGLPLPFELTPYGAPGCTLEVGLSNFVEVSLSGSSPPGSASITLPIPQIPSLSGAEILTQWVLLHSTSQGSVLGVSSALRIVLL